MLALMIGFFGLVITVNLVMAFYAAGTWPGLVVKSSYVASQHFNKNLEVARRQALLGWKSVLRIENAELVFLVRDAEKQPVRDLTIEAKLQRPVSDRSDRLLNFAQASEGRYVATAPVGKGRWVVDILSRDRGGNTYRQIFEITMK